jgi:hypothetical protein
MARGAQQRKNKVNVASCKNVKTEFEIWSIISTWNVYMYRTLWVCTVLTVFTVYTLYTYITPT